MILERKVTSRGIRFMIVLATLILSLGMAGTSAQAAKTVVRRSSVTINAGKSYRLKIKNEKSKLTWKSANSRIAKVTSSGRLTGVKKGTVTVTGTAKGKKYLCKVKVNQPATKISISKSKLSLKVGSKQKLTAKLYPSTVSSRKIGISTSNKRVASVNSKGEVKGVAPGTATITVRTKDGSNKKAVCKVTVTKKSSSGSSSKPSSNSGSSQKPVTNKKNAEKFVDILKGYDSQLRQSIASGAKWKYSNSNTESYFKNALSGKRKNVNCALLVCWGLRDMGIMGDNGNLWYDASGNFHWNSQVEAQIRAKCEIIDVQKKTAQKLADEGILQPGDICCWTNNQHMNIYYGDGKWFDAGRCGANGHWSGGTYYFDRFIMPGFMSSRVDYIIRVK